MSAISSLSQTDPAATKAAYVKKAVHAAHEFEAVLLNSLLDTFERTFTNLPGGNQKSSSYQNLGTQALATGLANSGGLGIASFIVRNLLKGQNLTASQSNAKSNQSPAKVSP